jgi:hypothetical protein
MTAMLMTMTSLSVIGKMSGRINEADCWNMIRNVIRTVTERTTTAPAQQLHDVSMVAIVNVSMVVNVDML